MPDDSKNTEEIKKEEPKEIKTEEAKSEVKNEKSSSVKATDDKKVSGNVGKLVDEIAKLSVLEVSELVSALQEKLGVTAQAAPAAPMAGQGAAQAGGDNPAEGGQGSGGGVQTVTMTGSGSNKIGVIKALREINPNLTLMDAKAMTENVPAEVLKDAKAEDVKSAVEKLKAAGATVELK